MDQEPSMEADLKEAGHALRTVHNIICARRNGLLSCYIRGREIYRTQHVLQRPESHVPDRLSGTIQKDHEIIE